MDPIVDKEIVELKQQIKMLTEQLADKGRGHSKTSEVIKVVIPARDRKVRKFTGEVEEDPYLLEDFLQEVDSVLSSTGRGPADQADFIISNLEGPAREEVKCLYRKEQSDPEKIKEALKEVFGEKSSLALLMSELYQRRQEPNESLQQYILALLMLAHRVASQKGDAEVVLRDIFAEYVSDISLRRELKRHLRDNPSETFRELRQYSLRWEQDGKCQPNSSTSKVKIKQHQAESNSLSTSKGNNDLLTKLAKQQEAIDALTAGMQKMLEGGGRTKRETPFRHGNAYLMCYGCHQPGHIKSKCPKRKAATEKAATSAVASADSRPAEKSEN